MFRTLVAEAEERNRRRAAAQRQLMAGGGGSHGGPGAWQQPATGAQAGGGAAGGGGGFERVVWVNRQSESHLPYDLYITHADESVTYVEVKSSAAAAKDLFEISVPELQFAAAQGERYLLVRVRGAGGPAPTLERLTDPVALLRQHRLSLCLAV